MEVARVVPLSALAEMWLTRRLGSGQDPRPGDRARAQVLSKAVACWTDCSPHRQGVTSELHEPRLGAGGRGQAGGEGGAPGSQCSPGASTWGPPSVTGQCLRATRPKLLQHPNTYAIGLISWYEGVHCCPRAESGWRVWRWHWPQQAAGRPTMGVSGGPGLHSPPLGGAWEQDGLHSCDQLTWSATEGLRKCLLGP